MRRARAITSLPAGVIAVRLLPLRVKELHAEFLFQQFQLLADARLAGIQPLGGCGYVKTAVGNGDQVFELLQSHGTGKCSAGLTGPI
jgi:hypothetical protein